MNTLALKRFLSHFLLLFIAAGTGVSYAQDVDRPGPLVVGAPVPPVLQYEFVDGTPIDLEKLKGKPYLIYLGADWCPPCFFARPIVLDVLKKYRAQGLQVIMLMSDPEKRREANVKIGLDAGVMVGISKKESCQNKDCRFGIDGGAWGAPKGSTTLPSVYVVDKQGVARIYLQRVEPMREKLELEVRKVL